MEIIADFANSTKGLLVLILIVMKDTHGGVCRWD